MEIFEDATITVPQSRIHAMIAKCWGTHRRMKQILTRTENVPSDFHQVYGRIDAIHTEMMKIFDLVNAMDDNTTITLKLSHYQRLHQAHVGALKYEQYS